MSQVQKYKRDYRTLRAREKRLIAKLEETLTECKRRALTKELSHARNRLRRLVEILEKKQNQIHILEKKAEECREKICFYRARINSISYPVLSGLHTTLSDEEKTEILFYAEEITKLQKILVKLVTKSIAMR